MNRERAARLTIPAILVVGWAAMAAILAIAGVVIRFWGAH